MYVYLVWQEKSVRLNGNEQDKSVRLKCTWQDK